MHLNSICVSILLVGSAPVENSLAFLGKQPIEFCSQFRTKIAALHQSAFRRKTPQRSYKVLSHRARLLQRSSLHRAVGAQDRACSLPTAWLGEAAPIVGRHFGDKPSMLLVTILLNDLQLHLRFGLEFRLFPQERAVLIHLGKSEGDMMALIVPGLDGGQSRERYDHASEIAGLSRQPRAR